VAGAWQSAHGMLGAWNSHRAMVQGKVRGLSFTAPESLVGGQPQRDGRQLRRRDGAADWCSSRSTRSRRWPCSSSSAWPTPAKVTDPKLGGRVEHLAPLLLDSVYHGLR
jgi:hypothetical protein